MATTYQTVVVPGFGGSSLSYRGGVGGKTRLWFKPAQMLATSPLALALATDGVSPYPVFGRTLFADGPVDLGIYEPLMTALANGGLSPVFWAHDWRLAQINLATQLVAFLNSLTLTDPFYVVCHSNGGLIAQLAYGAYAGQQGKPVWKTTVYLGTPHGGSYTAAQALGGVYSDGSELLLLAKIWNLATTQNPLLAAATETIKAALLTTVCSWPGLYGLLPNPGGAWAALDPACGQLLDKSTYGMLSPTQAQWFTSARAVQAAIIAGLAAARPYEVCLTGTSFRTADKFFGGVTPGDVRGYDFSADGDGTVPSLRAILPRKTQHEFDPCNHWQLCNSAAPLVDLLTDFVPPTVEPLNVKEVPNKPPILSFIPLPTPAPAGIDPSPFLNLTGDP